ncbi:exodeoxyribonuclease VII small subunit [Clostridium pasteurianum]|nr:exodeoxyribonuclease VII small subunit [Clostridium pasteurianum]AOZ75264.1 exodeoxyribonuclease VII small subunit [Clostridium pasteurianum DSM 525 = ATCC 6013]AOZ79059.1 exodeoxyribonuclease VII small subunit [Clostridium pasteurianum]ELP59882.1 exodeoxyribonuclease VII small subunit [Clostridium pasteurianum DSM 525 = ATCC 6013]OMH22493.1 exodeoxyribonuclease VII small subunit [Clostridium pasteurianum]UZW16150.1 exodeoxyribonuclease VII small subunit [Clostridium pasteurianum]
MTSRNESYESMVKKLEDIIYSMENKELTLQETMKSYEQGIKLCNKLYKYLNEAEGKIKILSNGQEQDFLRDGE